MSKYLYGLSTKGIQGFIFSTNELKSIIGGSGLIDSFKIKTDEKYSSIDENVSKENIIINAAGNIKIIFDEDQKEELKNLALNIVKSLKQKAYGVEIYQSIIEFKDGELYKAFSKLEQELNFERNKPNLPLDYSNFLMKIAPKSGRPADKNDLLDIATKQKFEFYNEHIKDEDKTKGYNIDKIPKNNKNKTAIIHADGNSLGVKIANLINKTDKSDKAVKEVYQNFSKNLEKATDEAFEEAVKVVKDKKDIRRVILGGDDLTVICSADIALEFTDEFIKAFEDKTDRLMDGKLTMCAGIAFCNHKFPFHYAINLAENLCSYAKEKSRSFCEKLPPSSVMFHNIQSSSISSYSDIIRTELTFFEARDKKDINLNFGPYFINEDDVKENLFITLKDFLEISDMFLLNNSPKSRIRDYLDILENNFALADERIKRIEQMIKEKSANQEDEFSVEKFNKKFKFGGNFSFTNPFVSRITKDKEIDNISYFIPLYDIISYLSVVEKVGVKNEKN